MILQARNSNNRILKKESSSGSIRCPLPLKRFASVRSTPEGKTTLNALSQIQEKEHSYSDDCRAHPSEAKNDEVQQVRNTLNLI